MLGGVVLDGLVQAAPHLRGHREACLLYTSDAADDPLCVELGGRRIIKKKNIIRSCQTLSGINGVHEHVGWLTTQQ